MRSRAITTWGRIIGRVVMSWAILAALPGASAHGQTGLYQRTFANPKIIVEQVLKTMQPNMAGRLPTLEGFVQPGQHPLTSYDRGYYQATVQVTATPTGTTLVRVNMKVTAWHNDPVASRAGYQALTSNGRLETDLLDQLAEQLSKTSAESGGATPPTAPTPSAAPPTKSTPVISSPAPSFSETDRKFSSSRGEGSLNESLAAQERANHLNPEQANADKSSSALQAEADSLEEILKNQAHPKNLVAVKKSGTPVVGAASLTAKPLFLASQHDEFELLDFNADWVHVRISGLSRGWIWRNSVEMPEGIPDTDTNDVSAPAPAADLFRVIREETAPFPGDWEPLRGKNVKIISVQKVDDSTKDAGPRGRLEYAKSLLDKNYSEIAQKSQSPELAGVVLIFDSADGGMIAAPLPALQQWRAGGLSDSALWHNCFFDPPETFDSAVSPASR